MQEVLELDEAQLRKAIDEIGPLASDLPADELVATAMAVVRGEMQLKHVKGLTDDEMEAAYAQGYGLFRAGNLAKAEEVFSFLATFDNGERKYWTALGAVRFNRRNHAGALMAYSQAAILEVDTGLMVRIAQCRIGMGEREIARGALEAAIELAGDDVAMAGDKARAAALIDLLDEAA